MNTSGASLSLKRRREVTPAEFERLKNELRILVNEKCKPLPDEPHYATSDETLSKFLQARKFVVQDAFKQLSGAIEWRRRYRPLSIQCKWCEEVPGFHGIRQIGFDGQQRPVMYACFLQCQTTKNTAEDVIAHTVYLVENAMRCNELGRTSMVFIIDCTGLSLACCNPKMGKDFAQTFSNNYPEHLAKFYLLHQSKFLRGVWRTIKVFIDPETVKKVKLIKANHIERTIREEFDPEMATWFLEEIYLNNSHCSENQRRFWRHTERNNARIMHDPRGTPSYVSKYIEPLIQRQRHGEFLNRSTVGMNTHLPHPNIVQQINGTIKNLPLIEMPKCKTPSKKEMEQYGLNSSNAGSDSETEE